MDPLLRGEASQSLHLLIWISAQFQVPISSLFAWIPFHSTDLLEQSPKLNRFGVVVFQVFGVLLFKEVLAVVLVEWLKYQIEELLSERLTLANLVFVDFRR